MSEGHVYGGTYTVKQKADRKKEREGSKVQQHLQGHIANRDLSLDLTSQRFPGHTKVS